MIVLDASAVVALLVTGGPVAGQIADRVTAGGQRAAPHLLDVEFANALRRIVGPRDAQLATELLDDLAGLRLTYYPHLPLLGRAIELGSNLSTYDAVYIALAEVLDCPLLTCDQRLGRTPGHNATVEVFG